MHPILFTIPLFGSSIDIPTYGVLLALAFVGILQVVSLLARREGVPARDMVDLSFTVFLAGLLGAKLLLILLDWRFYLSNPTAITGVLRSAGVFYGGLLAAIPTAIWFAHKRRLPLWKVADITAVCIPIGLAVGRLGCFAAGCCFGKPAFLPWSVTYTSELAHNTTGVPLGVPTHPTQLYMSLNALLLTLILLAMHRRKAFDGQVFWWFFILYGATRSFWELFRGDEVRGFLVAGWLSTSQTIGLVSVIAGILLLRWRRSRATLDAARP